MTTWAELLARAAIEAMREPTDEMIRACSGEPHNQLLARAFFDAMIDAALKESK